MSEVLGLEVLKALQLVGVTLLIGPSIFWQWVWGPAVTADSTTAHQRVEAKLVRRMRLLTATGVVMLLGAGLVDLARIALAVADPTASPGAVLMAALAMIGGTKLGLLLAGRLVFGALLWACRLRSPAAPRTQKWLVAYLSLMVTGGFAFAGHSAATAGTFPWPALADMVHLLATAAWYGGLVCLTLVPWTDLVAGDRPSLVGRVVGRFSHLGLLTMGLLALTGLALAARHLYGPEALIEEPYGETLLFKLAFVAGVLALAAINHLVVRPRLRDRSGEERTVLPWLRWLMAGEVALGLAVVSAAGVLSATPPPMGAPVRLTVTMQEGRLDPPVLEIPRNKTIRLTVVNAGTKDHIWVVPRLPHEMPGHSHGRSMMNKAAYVEAGQKETLVFIVRTTGEYQAFCMETGHKAAGETQRIILK